MATILCIDDDPRTLELEKAIFEQLGYVVLASLDGVSALAAASHNDVNVAVLDYRMPGMDGAEVAEALWRQRPGLPIVVCTGYFDTIPEWLKWFAAGCVQKGDGPEALVSAVRALLPRDSQSSAA